MRPALLTALLALLALAAGCGQDGVSYSAEPVADCSYSKAGVAFADGGLLVRSGQVPTGGWSFAVEDVRVEDGVVVVESRLEPPPEDAVVTQALVNHCARVEFDDEDALEGVTNWRLLVQGLPQGDLTLFGPLTR